MKIKHKIYKLKERSLKKYDIYTFGGDCSNLFLALTCPAKTKIAQGDTSYYWQYLSLKYNKTGYAQASFQNTDQKYILVASLDKL